MKNFFAFILILAVFDVYSQVKIHKSFENLTRLDFMVKETTMIDESISFNSLTTEIINKKRYDLDKDDPFYAEEYDGDILLLIKTKLLKSSDSEYYVCYNTSSGFIIFKDSPDNRISFVNASKLVVPGNGFIYSEGRHGSSFPVRRKLKLVEDDLIEINQPFYYVGIKSKTLKTIKIYQERDLMNLIATLPKNYEIEVLLCDDDYESDLYLVRTSFGLTGWTKIEDGATSSTDIDGIYYLGQ
jgi:hypothetical protein